VALHATDLEMAAALAEREHLLIRAASGYPHAVSGLPDKLQAVRAAVESLVALAAPHALIGGLAVGIRAGVPRATLDVDFAIATSVDRPALTERLIATEFALVGEFPHSINFRHRSGEPLQLAFDPLFDAMIARAEPVSVDDFSLLVVTKADLIAMKRRAAADPARRKSKALRDQADVALLEGDVPEPDEGW
jgi:nucleotidyltransferase AbiEii toxin of type IV toxin-antitoxin system